MTNQEKIQILMKEYETLRSEMSQRYNHRFQFITILGALIGFALLHRKDLFFTYSLSVVTLLIIFIVWYWIGCLIVNCSERVSEIEKQVNELAGQELLQWETKQKKNGVIHIFHNIPPLSWIKSLVLRRR